MNSLWQDLKSANVLKSRLFWLGLAIRIGFMPFFGSHYARDLFIPFLDAAVKNPFTNPWSLNPPHFFPYGSVLFAVLFVPRYFFHLILGDVALGTGWLGMTLLKAPLLAFDALLFLVLRKFAGDRKKKLTLFYWLNPIIIFITYVYGQLDVGAMSLCLLSLLLLTRRKIAFSAVALALAALCKFHVVAIVPFILAYIWHLDFARAARQNLALWLGLFAVVAGLGFLPLVFADRLLYASTTSPEAFRLFSLQIAFGSGGVLYLGIFIVLAVLGRLCVSTRISEKGLVFGSAAVFGTLLLVVYPFPSWFFWVVPFLSLFFAIYVNIPAMLFAALTGVYYLYYVGLLMLYPSDELTLYRQLSFTVLQLTLGGILVSLWRLAVKPEAVLYGRVEPVFLGVAGDSGSGKNYFSELCRDLFNDTNTVVLEGDDYHKWERGDQHWNEYTHLNPRANHLFALAEHADKLSKGIPVMQSQYDHGSGYFVSPREIKPSKTVLIQGLHSFYLRGMRDKFDLKVYLAPKEQVRLAWQLKRDVGERGHSKEKVVERFDGRVLDSKTHISPQQAFADWIVEFFPLEEISREEILKGRVPKLAVRYTVWNDAPIGPVVEQLRELGEIKFEPPGESVDRVSFAFIGEPTAAQVAAAAEKSFSNLRIITRGTEPPTWRAGYDGVTQLLVAAHLSAHSQGGVSDALH